MSGIVIFAVIGAVIGLIVGAFQAFLLKVAFKGLKFSVKILIYIAKLILWAAPMVVLALCFGIISAVAFAVFAGPVFLILSLLSYKKTK